MAVEEGSKGIIWSSGIHQVYVNGKPSRLFVPQYKILPIFEKLQKKLTGGAIPMGIDHLPDEVLAQYPILAKMNPLDVGGVTRAGTDGDKIFIEDSYLENPTIQQLHKEGALPAYSVVGKIDADPCSTGQADYVLKDLDIRRVDYVEAGGCSACKVGDNPEGLILMSKLSMEVDNVSKDETNLEAGASQEENEENPAGSEEEENTAGEEEAGEGEESSEEEGSEGEEEEEEADNSVEARLARIEGAVGTMADTVNKIVKGEIKASLPDETQKAMDDLTLEAKKAKVGVLIEAGIKAGKVTPAMEEALTDLGLADEEKLTNLLAKMAPQVDFSEKSKKKKEEQTLEAKAPKNLSKEDRKAWLEAQKILKEDTAKKAILG